MAATRREFNSFILCFLRVLLFNSNAGFRINCGHAVCAGLGAGGPQEINGASLFIDGEPFKIADTATAIPDGTGNFTGFGAVSLSESGVAFLGTGAGDQTGIYVLTGGQLRKAISVGEAIQGKTITGLSFSRDGLSEDGAVAFQATFSDGSQGVYTMDVPQPPAELRITDIHFSGTELRISFPAVSEQSYVIESRADLAAGEWTEVAGTKTISSGTAFELVLQIGLAQPRQF